MEKYWELGIDEWVSYMYIYHDENKLFSMKWSCGFVLDQRAEMDLYSASSLKQQSVGRHVASLGYIILIPSQPVFALTP
jgi:hypothetical protein